MSLQYENKKKTPVLGLSEVRLVQYEALHVKLNKQNNVSFTYSIGVKLQTYMKH